MKHLSCLGLFIALCPTAFCNIYPSSVPLTEESTVMPWTDYYNLKGKLVKHVEDGLTDRHILQTRKSRQSVIDDYISKKYYLVNPAEDLVIAITEAYEKTEATNSEHYFAIGAKGTVSSVTTGSFGAVTTTASNQARRDLVDKGDLYAQDAHSHNNVYDENGEIVKYGKALPSTPNETHTPESDMTDPSLDHRVRIILGWREGGSIPSSVNTVGNSEIKRSRYRSIGFYNKSGKIATIDADQLMKVIRKLPPVRKNQLENIQPQSIPFNFFASHRPVIL